MREEALGQEAAGLVRQAVWLARQRGHAQVTPLHMASSMLSASASAAGVLLRAACVRSQSHLLQLNALDLCLEGALVRLAKAEIHHVHRGGYEGGWHVGPAWSNAFVAALRRALANVRRRGNVDGGQIGQIELEQLAVSVLDDPSVDRVVSTAGLSSSQLRAGIENAASAVPSEQSNRTLRGGAANKQISAGGQTSLETVPELHRPVVADVPAGGSESQASQKRSGTTRPGFFDGSELAGMAAILPPWFPHYQDIVLTGATRYGTSSLPVDVRMARGCIQIQGLSSSSERTSTSALQAARRGAKFTELTAQNMKILSEALELRCPRHGDIIPGISSTVLWCRSGMTRRRTRKQQPTSSSSSPTSTCLLFRGRDAGGKTAIARELAKLVFGSYTEFVMISSDTPARSSKHGLKRQRSPVNGNDGYAEARLFEAILENPRRVILIDGVDWLDRNSAMRIKDAIAEGTMVGCHGNVLRLDDAIVVLCSDSGSMVSSPRVKRRIRINRQDREQGDAMGKGVRLRSLDLNVCPEDGEDEEDISAEDPAIFNVQDGVFFFN